MQLPQCRYLPQTFSKPPSTPAGPSRTACRELNGKGGQMIGLTLWTSQGRSVAGLFLTKHTISRSPIPILKIEKFCAFLFWIYWYWATSMFLKNSTHCIMYGAISGSDYSLAEAASRCRWGRKLYRNWRGRFIIYEWSSSSLVFICDECEVEFEIHCEQFIWSGYKPAG
jgi:hypothetical protein